MNMPATFWMRLLAHNIDMVILLIPTWGLSLLIRDNHLLYFLTFFMYFLYQLWFELGSWNATPGKRIMGLRVLMSDHVPPTFLAIMFRNIGKILSLLLFFVGFAFIAFHRRRLSLHDLASRTYVAYYGSN